LIPIGTAFIIGLVFIALFLHGLPAVPRRRLLTIVLLAFVIRLCLSTCLELYPRARIFHDDAAGYEKNAVSLANYWKGSGPPFRIATKGGYNYGYLYVGGFLCYLFGSYPLNLSAWNSLFGVLSVIVLYRLSATLFHPAVAMRAAMLMAFMPSMILWSSVAIKDPLMVLLVSSALYLYILLRRRWSMLHGLLLGGLIISIFFIRFYVTYYVILSIMATVLMGRSRDGFKFGRNLLVLVSLLAVVALSGLASNFSEGLESATLDRAASFRVGMANTANSGFARDLDVRTPGGLATVLPLGLAVLFFGPFPWQMRGTLPLMTLPEMLFWWTLIPALWRGLRFAIRHAFMRISPVLVFCASLSLFYAITLGNVGAAVRQRAQIFIFLFIFVALGKYLKECQRRRIHPSLLLSPDPRS
jgi:hypothetical protein